MPTTCVSTIVELTVLLKQMKSDETGFRDDFESRRNHCLKKHASYEPTANPEENIMMCRLKVLKAGEEL